MRAGGRSSSATVAEGGRQCGAPCSWAHGLVVHERQCSKGCSSWCSQTGAQTCNSLLNSVRAVAAASSATPIKSATASCRVNC